eukprot:9474-Heterococcus_DN1.PRE.2
MHTFATSNSYDDAETFAIVKRRFAERKGIMDLSERTGVSSNTTDTVTGVITPDQLLMQYELYKEVVKLVQERKVGRGGTYDINLRDLLKLLDVLDGNAQHLRDHYEHEHQHTATSANTTAADDVLMLALHSIASLVYARRFQSQADQARVMAVIDKMLPLSSQLLARLDFNKAIDASVPGIVRIGTVYIDKGTHQHDDNDGSHQQLVHSAETIADLETLAAAVQSKRAVLLEGETCSGKTALVQELARVCDKKLIVIPLSHETDTADLIGQWLPVQHKKHSSSTGGSSSATGCQVVIGEIAKCLLTFVMPVCVQSDSADASHVGQQLQQLVPTMLHAARNTDNIDQLSNVISKTCDVLTACTDVKAIPTNIRSECRSLQQLLFKTANTTQHLAQHGTGKHALAFEFVEAELVRAIRNGDWVLLDNLAAAPQEVIERISSLLEEQPTLHLTEVANGDELTVDNGGIHSEFRVFATANMRRVHTNKLSTALLNRVLRVWLPPLDAELLEAIAAVDASSADVVNARTQAIEKTNTFALVCNLLPDVVGKCKLAHLLLRFHIYMQQKIADKAITLAGGAVLTFRHLKRTINSIHARLTQQSNKTTLPVPALIDAIRLNYIDCVITDNSKGDVTLHTVLNGKLDTLLATPAIQDAVQPEHTRVNATATQQPWQTATSELSIVMSSIEGLAVTLAAAACVAHSMSPADTCKMLTLLINSKLAPVTDTTAAAAQLQQFKAAHGHVTALSALDDDVYKDCSAVLKHCGLTIEADTITDASVADMSGHIQRLYHLACEAVVQLANGASLLDAKSRWRVLQRVVETCGAHAALLESVHSEQESLMKAVSVCGHALQALTQLVSRTVLRYGELLCMQELQQLRQACQHVLKAESGSLQHYYVLQKHLTLPIASSTTTGALMSMAAKLVHKLEQVDSSGVVQLERLVISAQWTGIAYNALMAMPRTAELDTDITSDKLLETATLLDTELNMRLCKVLSAIEAPPAVFIESDSEHYRCYSVCVSSCYCSVDYCWPFCSVDYCCFCSVDYCCLCSVDDCCCCTI